jgi:hypothetical protein
MSEVDSLINSLESKLKISEDVKTLMNYTTSYTTSYTSCKSINERISTEICNDTIKALSDVECLDTYKGCESLKKNVISLTSVLKKNEISEEQQKKITDDYLLSLIPPGLKGVIRGNKFNQIVKEHILSLNLDSELYTVAFESNCSEYKTSEIPDWYILNKLSKKLMIGMNQLDLWGGGQQINRGSKYIVSFPDNSEKIKLVCVVANPITLSSEKNKAFKLFQKGFEENTLCYLKNLKNILDCNRYKCKVFLQIK